MADKLILRTDAIDVEDVRDYSFEEYMQYKEEAQGVAPICTRLENEVIVQDQGSIEMCTRMGMTHDSNGYNCWERNQQGKVYQQIQGLTMWDKSDKQLTLLSALQQFKNAGLIDGRVDIKNNQVVTKIMEQVDKALVSGYFIYTGSLSGDWSKIGKTLVYQDRADGKNNGHAFGLVEKVVFKGKNMYKCINSFGPNWGDKGYFYLNPEDILKLYTKHVLIDHKDVETFGYFKAIQYAKEAVRQLKKLYATVVPTEVEGKIHDMAEFLREFYKFTDKDL